MRAIALAAALAPILVCTELLCGQTQPSETPQAVVSRLVDMYNRHDVEGFLALYADTVVVMGLGDTIARRMPQTAGRAPTSKLFTDNPHVRAENVTLSVTGPYVMTHERQTGWADGKTREWLDLYDVRKGKIVAERAFPWP